jgi:hypothetical protein
MSRQTPALPADASESLVRARATEARIAVIDDDSAAVAALKVKDLRALETAIKAHHKPAIDAATLALKSVKDMQAAWLAPVAEARAYNETEVREYEARKRDAFRAEQEAARAAAQATAQEAALADAVALEGLGLPELAEARLQHADVVLPVVVAPPSRVAGTVTYERRDLEVLDVRAVLAAVLTGALPLAVADINMTALREQWRHTGEIPPGCGVAVSSVTAFR